VIGGAVEPIWLGNTLSQHGLSILWMGQSHYRQILVYIAHIFTLSLALRACYYADSDCGNGLKSAIFCQEPMGPGEPDPSHAMWDHSFRPYSYTGAWIDLVSLLL
jgi:hypothetical protein